VHRSKMLIQVHACAPQQDVDIDACLCTEQDVVVSTCLCTAARCLIESTVLASANAASKTDYNGFGNALLW
jgi:hypothetical protein